MKLNARLVLYSTLLGLALVAVMRAPAQRTALRLDAPTPEGRITQLNAQLLEQMQFAHRRLDERMVAEFLDRYLDALDGSRELFLQSDVEEFRRYQPHLAKATVRAGDTSLARTIFDRYLQRVRARADYVEGALAEESFDFTGNDRYQFDREEAQRPRDMAAAQVLWRQRLRADVLREKIAGSDSEKIVETVEKRYRRHAETTANLSDDAVLEIYLNALADVYDPHSDYMGAERLASFNISMKLSLAGVGASLSAEGDYCEIRSLVPGGPAARSGKLAVGDRIVAVAQGVDGDPTDLFNLPLGQVVELVRGPKGTKVTLTVIPAGASDDARKRVTIERDDIHMEDQEAKASVVDLPSDGEVVRLGIIDLPAFYTEAGGEGQSATADVARLIRRLQQEEVAGIILDLRRNGGGSLEEAIDLTGLFIPSGAVVQTRDLYGRTNVGADDDGLALYQGPLVVLTSRFSASASEIVAGALQDYGRALVVGDTSTFGKGTVQRLLSLGDIMMRNRVRPEEDPGALKVTIGKFYRPSGSSTQLRGVTPDIVLPSLTDIDEIGEAAMDNALAWDAVPPARYPRYEFVEPFLPTLRERSLERVSKDPMFDLLLEEIAIAKENRNTRSVSMNENERRRELEERKARNEARKAEGLSRAKTRPTVYEISLKNVDSRELVVKDASPYPAMPDAPVGDLLLEETQRILSDYVGLLHAGSLVDGAASARAN